MGSFHTNKLFGVFIGLLLVALITFITIGLVGVAKFGKAGLPSLCSRALAGNTSSKMIMLKVI